MTDKELGGAEERPISTGKTPRWYADVLKADKEVVMLAVANKPRRWSTRHSAARQPMLNKVM